MAVTTKLVSEALISGSTRAKIFSAKHDGSTVACTITPGTNFNSPIGSYVSFRPNESNYFAKILRWVSL